MTTLKEDLWKTLEDLTDAQFKQFKWFLKENDMPEGFSAIPVAPLESADRQDTVDLMVQKYNCLGALEITIRVWKKSSRNDLVQNLSSTNSSMNGKLMEVKIRNILTAKMFHMCLINSCSAFFQTSRTLTLFFSNINMKERSPCWGRWRLK